MTAKFRIEGGGDGPEAYVMEHKRKVPGLVSYTHPLDHYDFSLRSLTNEVHGVSMAINPSTVAPTTALIHNGTDTAGWTASNVVGGSFVFNSTAQAFEGTRSIDATGTANNDTASFTAPAPINPSIYTSFRAAFYLVNFPTSGTKDITLQWFSAGAPVSPELSIKPYIGTLNFGVWQIADIPFSDFGLAGVPLIDELRIKSIDSGPGQAPDYYMDKLEIVEAGVSTGVAAYRFAPDFGEDYSLLKMRIFAYNASKTNPDPDEFFGLPPLTGGFELVLRNKKRVFVSLIARDVWDFIRAPNTRIVTTADGSAGAMFFIEFEIPLEHMQILGSEGTFVEVRVKDDLSGLARLETSLHLARLREDD